MKTVTVWHFAGDALRDGSPLPKAGDVLPAIDNPRLCSRGWHGSERLIDALAYAPGANLARRVLSGDIQRGDDKCCASQCIMATGYVDARPLLIEFARYAALRALREYAPAALERAGLKEHAAKLRDLPDDGNLRDAADAAYAAADAADAAYAAYAAAYAAARAADAAARAADAAARATDAAARAADAADAADAAYAAAYAAARAAARAADAADAADAAYAAARAADAAYAAARAARAELNSWLEARASALLEVQP